MWTKEVLWERLTRPSERLVADMKRLRGDVMILGAGGKMGPSLAALAKNACDAAGLHNTVWAVSRFSDRDALRRLHETGVKTVSADLTAPGTLEALPGCENIIFMAGRKFGTSGQEPLTWGMNAYLPALTARRFAGASLVVFSSGNIYPYVDAATGGATEDTPPRPRGEYAQSCLARERIFEYAAMTQDVRVLLYRLNYAVALEYGVLYDVARYIMEDRPVPVTNPCFNCIWQGDANEYALRALLHTAAPAARLNVTGPEIIGVRQAARSMGAYLGKAVAFDRPEEQDARDALVSSAARCHSLMGYPAVGAGQLMEMQAQWLLDGGAALDKPTHFEERGGIY